MANPTNCDLHLSGNNSEPPVRPFTFEDALLGVSERPALPTTHEEGKALLHGAVVAQSHVREDVEAEEVGSHACIANNIGLKSSTEIKRAAVYAHLVS